MSEPYLVAYVGAQLQRIFLRPQLLNEYLALFVNTMIFLYKTFLVCSTFRIL